MLMMTMLGLCSRYSHSSGFSPALHSVGFAQIVESTEATLKPGFTASLWRENDPPNWSMAGWRMNDGKR